METLAIREVCKSTLNYDKRERVAILSRSDPYKL